jgi:hypothetical protein
VLVIVKPPRPVKDFPHTKEACGRKKRFEDEAAAWDQLLKARRIDSQAATQQPYACAHCNGWHLGHRPGTLDKNGEVRGTSGRREVLERNPKCHSEKP